jgi:lipopolysaccharide export system protein LptA
MIGCLSSSKLCIFAALFASLAIAVPAASAKTIHVPADQATIQAGINAAVNGDTVLVSPGTYLENINFNGKAITVTSANGPNSVYAKQ